MHVPFSVIVFVFFLIVLLWFGHVFSNKGCFGHKRKFPGFFGKVRIFHLLGHSPLKQSHNFTCGHLKLETSVKNSLVDTVRAGKMPIVVNGDVSSHPNPSLPKSPKYLVSRCLDPLKAFSAGVCGSKHLLTRYLED